MRRAVAVGSGIVVYRQPNRSGTMSIDANHQLPLGFPVGEQRCTRLTVSHG
jgi:hypothetical protein